MLRIKTAATVEPVTPDEAKAHASVHSTAAEDTQMIAGMISAARQKFEDEAAFQVSQATYEWELMPWLIETDGEGRQFFNLPLRPALSVVSIGDLVAPAAEIVEDLEADPPIVGVPAVVGDWTFAVDRRGVGRVRLNDGISLTEETVVEFTAGYADPTGQQVHGAPWPVKQAIMMLVAHWYMNREAYGDSMKATPRTFDSIVSQYRLA